MDGKCKIWDSHSSEMQTYIGHSEGIRAIKMSNTGNHFLSTGFDRYIRYWDVETGQAAGTYSSHVILSHGRKFVSTSDDKKILVWEFDIPVPIKYIADPAMHCIPSVSVHPSHAFFAGQSMDNKIVVYSCGDKVRQITKKTFVGHNNSAKLISVRTKGMGSGRCTSGIGKQLNVTENSMHMTMGRVWLLFGILCYRVALPHADGMD